MRYAFADFQLDTDRCVLTHGRKVVTLRPKAFDLLTVLVESAGKVVGKEALFDALWPDVTVQENSLTQCVTDLRRSLGDDGGRLIQTVPKRGYILDSSVRRDTNIGSPGMRWPKVAAAAVIPASIVVAVVVLTQGPVRSAAPVEPRKLIETSSTVLGQPLVWPEGSARLVSGITVLAPGEVSEWHSHSVPLFAYILSGEIATNYGTAGELRYPAGTALVEAVKSPHQARNVGTEWAEILYVLVGTEETPLRSKEDPPKD